LEPTRILAPFAQPFLVQPEAFIATANTSGRVRCDRALCKFDPKIHQARINSTASSRLNKTTSARVM